MPDITQNKAIFQVCPDCAKAAPGLCPICEQQRLMVRLTIELVAAADTAAKAYAAWPNNSVMARLKARINVTVRDVGREAGLNDN